MVKTTGKRTRLGFCRQIPHLGKLDRNRNPKHLAQLRPGSLRGELVRGRERGAVDQLEYLAELRIDTIDGGVCHLLGGAAVNGDRYERGESRGKKTDRSLLLGRDVLFALVQQTFPLLLQHLDFFLRL